MKKLLFTLFILLAPTLASAATIGKVPSNNIGLVGYWTFDGADMVPNVRDKSGSGNNGVLQAFVSTTTATGKFGQALSFDGVDDRVSVANASNQVASTTSYTISTWVKFNAIPDQTFQTIVGQWKDCGPGTGGWAHFGISSASIGNYIYLGSDQNVTAGTVAAGEWNHLVATVEKLNATTYAMSIYKNGVLAGSEVKTGTWTVDAACPVYIGSKTGGNSNNVNGSIDEVRIYNRALTATEVRALYNSGSAGVARSSVGSTTSPLSNGLVGYWTLDGSKTNWATGKTLDSSGQGNTAQLVGLSTSTTPTSGKVGQSFAFNGTNYTEAPDSASLSPTGAITISAWVNYRSINSLANNSIVAKFNGYGLKVTGGAKAAGYRWAGPENHDSVTTITPNTWYFLTMTFDGATHKIYINGILENSETDVASIPDGSDPVIIGSDGFSSYSNAKIDDVRIYNRALSASEVSQLYNSGTPKIASSNTSTATPLGSGLVSYWTFDGSKTNWTTGKTLDSVGSREGTLVGMDTATTPVAGRVGQAFNFDGIDDDITATLFNLSNYSWCGWVKGKTNSSSANVKQIISNSVWGFSWSHSQATFQQAVFHQDTLGTFTAAKFTTTIVAGVWYYMCGTYDGTNLRAYLNGVNEATTPSAAVNTNGNFHMAPDAGTRFDGTIDEVRIYNRALTTTEIQQLYNMAR